MDGEIIWNPLTRTGTRRCRPPSPCWRFLLWQHMGGLPNDGTFLSSDFYGTRWFAFPKHWDGQRSAAWTGAFPRDSLLGSWHCDQDSTFFSTQWSHPYAPVARVKERVYLPAVQCWSIRSDQVNSCHHQAQPTWRHVSGANFWRWVH